jgi:Peptidase family M23
MTGTKYAHTSQGVEIFGSVGTPVLAVVDGVIAKKGTSILGGNKLWLQGNNGSEFYYARIDFNQDIENRSAVIAGEVIGFIGSISPDLPIVTIPPASSPSKPGDKLHCRMIPPQAALESGLSTLSTIQPEARSRILTRSCRQRIGEIDQPDCQIPGPSSGC